MGSYADAGENLATNMPLEPGYGERARSSEGEKWSDARATRQLVVFLAVVLAAVALWPLASAFAWFATNRPLVGGGLRNDMFGTGLLPILMMSIRPGIAAAAALSCPLVSFLVVASHPQRAFGILVRAALGVGAAALTILLLGLVLNPLLASLFSWLRPVGAIEPTVSVNELILRQNAAATSVVMPLLGIAIAFAAVAMLSRSAPAPPIDSVEAITAMQSLLGVRASAADERLRDAPPQQPSAAANSFNELTYRVRARPRLPLGLRKFFDVYEIRGTGHERFSYSMRSGLLKRERDGAVIFSLSRRVDSLTDTFDVVDSETGTRAGSFRSRVNGWDIDDALGRPILFIVRDIEESDRVRYIAGVGNDEVCRYTWSFGPLGLFNVALEIDFAQGGPPFDRALAVALGPFIEEEARLISEKLRRFND